MGILGWLLFGLLVGWVASMLMHSRRRGLIRNIVLGLLGSFLGGWIASFFGIGSVNSFSLESFGIALGGAVLLILIFRRL